MFTAPAARDSLVRDAVDYIGRNPTTDLSTPARAQRAGLSQEALLQRLRSVHAVSPSQYRAMQSTLSAVPSP